MKKPYFSTLLKLEGRGTSFFYLKTEKNWLFSCFRAEFQDPDIFDVPIFPTKRGGACQNMPEKLKMERKIFFKSLPNNHLCVVS
jgi:hypothetical protein